MTTNGTTALATFENQLQKRQAHQASGVAVAASETRALAEVQAAMTVAKRFPRNEHQSITRILKSCERYALADSAMYAYRRGKEIVTGPSIRLMEVVAQHWGNLDFGVIELERRRDVSLMQSYCWDLETNTRSVKTFEVPHARKAKKEIVSLDDPRDVYEHVANMSARRMRACIEQIIPRDVTDAALAACERTLEIGATDPDGNPVQTREDRVRDLILNMDRVGVSVQDIERFFGRQTAQLTTSDLVKLQAIGRAIAADPNERDKFFGSSAPRTSELAETFSKTKSPPPADSTPPDDAPGDPRPAADPTPDPAPSQQADAGGEQAGGYEPGADDDEPEDEQQTIGHLSLSQIHGKTLKGFYKNELHTLDDIERVIAGAEFPAAVARLAEYEGITKAGAEKVLQWWRKTRENEITGLHMAVSSCIRGEGENANAIDTLAKSTGADGIETAVYSHIATLLQELGALSSKPGDAGEMSERRAYLAEYGI